MMLICGKMLPSVIVMISMLMPMGDTASITSSRPLSKPNQPNPSQHPYNQAQVPRYPQLIHPTTHTANSARPLLMDDEDAVINYAQPHTDFHRQNFLPQSSALDYRHEFATVGPHQTRLLPNGRLQRTAHPAFDADQWSDQLIQLNHAQSITWATIEDILYHYQNMEIVRQEESAVIYSAQLNEARRLSSKDAMMMPPGTSVQIHVRSLQHEGTWRELEAVSRLAWLSEHQVTDVFVRPLGMFVAPCQAFPFYRQMIDTGVNEFCLAMEMEWTDDILMDEEKEVPVDYQDWLTGNSMAEIPDGSMMELIWGEMAAARLSHMILPSQTLNQFGVNHVEQWRIYQLTTRTLKGKPLIIAQYAIPPQIPMLKHLDVTAWTPISTLYTSHNNNDDEEQQEVNPMTDLQTVFQQRISEQSANALTHLSADGQNLPEVLDTYFKQFRRPVDWIPPHASRMYRLEL